MKRHNPSSKLPLSSHIRLGIELGIAQHRLFEIHRALFAYYPGRVLPSERMSNSILTLKSVMENKLIVKDYPHLSEKRLKHIYFENLGQEIAKLQGDSITTSERVDSVCGKRKKNGLIAKEYNAIIKVLRSIHDLFWFYGLILSTTYLPDEKPGELCFEICTACNEFLMKLEIKLIEEHGPGHEMFLHEKNNRDFLENSFTDLRPFKAFISDFLKGADVEGVQ